MASFSWEHKKAASDALYGFLLLHTTDDAQQLVELQQDENGPEAWRQLSIRFDPICESFIFDQMASLTEVSRCKQLTELPAALTKWERSLRNFSEPTGGSQDVPPEWKLPILFKMIPLNMMGEIKIKQKYTTGMDKTYEGFSRLLLEMANEKVYDRRAAKGRGENDMDLDALGSCSSRQIGRRGRPSLQRPTRGITAMTARTLTTPTPSGSSTRRAPRTS